MMYGLRLLIFPALLLCCFSYATCKDCLITNLCSCTFDDGSGKVDISSLGNKDNTPKFKDVLYSGEGNYYSYNPCCGFTEGACANAAACILNPDMSEQEQIGDASKAAFEWNGDHPVVSYTSGTGVLRVTDVTLVCDPRACEAKFEPNGEHDEGQFEMTLTTVCACPGMCDSNGPLTNCSGGGGGSSVCFTTSAEFTKRCHHSYDGKDEPIKVLIIDNWDGVCKFPSNTDVAVSLYNNRSTCEGVVNRCSPKQPFSVNGQICQNAEQKVILG